MCTAERQSPALYVCTKWSCALAMGNYGCVKWTMWQAVSFQTNHSSIMCFYTQVIFFENEECQRMRKGISFSLSFLHHHQFYSYSSSRHFSFASFALPSHYLKKKKWKKKSFVVMWIQQGTLSFIPCLSPSHSDVGALAQFVVRNTKHTAHKNSPTLLSASAGIRRFKWHNWK